MENFLFLKPVRPFPTPVTAKFLPSHAGDRWGPRGLLKKNYIPCVCALLPAAQASGGTACAPCPERRLGCAEGMWSHAVHHHAHERLRPTRLSIHTSRSRQCTVLCPAAAFPQQAQGSRSRDSDLSPWDSLLSPALFISDWLFWGTGY